MHVITIQVPEFIAVANERKRVEKGAMIATYFNTLTPTRSSDEDCADNCSSNIF